MQAEWIAVDWGTSNVRAWGLAGDGSVVFSSSSDQGMGRLVPGDYPAVLNQLLAQHDARTLTEVLICGMAGAKQGWKEAPYLDVPADLSGISFGSVSPDGANERFSVRILPGLCQRGVGHEDVMRGEETQLLGLSTLLAAYSGPVIMPGTHSKWAMLEGRRVSRFATVMTGEMFALLGTHSVLRHSLGTVDDETAQADGFAEGATLGLDHPEKLLATLFKVRAGSLLSGRGSSWSSGFLSGLLIGSEVGGQRDWLHGAPEIPLIGGVKLCNLYSKVLHQVGARSLVVDATDATLAGLRAARR